MRMKLLIAALCCTVAIVLCSGCRGNIDPAVADAIGALPFSVPETFSYDEEATGRNEMLTFTSRSGTTLIVSCTASTPAFLDSTREQEITAASLTASYKASGLDVSIEGLDKQSTEDGLLYTYTVHLASQNGNTVTRKYIKVTADQMLDISCGGGEGRDAQVAADYDAVVQAVDAGAEKQPAEETASDASATDPA